MIVYYLYVIRIAIVPAKADSPLLIDADAVLSFPIAGEFFQTIRRRDSQVFKRIGRLQNLKLHSCFALNVMSKPPGKPAIEHLFGFPRRKGTNHTLE